MIDSSTHPASEPRDPHALPRLPLTDLSQPLPAGTSVRDARDQYLAENGFLISEYTSPTFRLKVLGRYFDLPNSRDRQWAIPLHDLHHVATGYGTDFVGEAEIGVWELRAGCRTWVVYYLNATAAFIGLFLAPRRMLAAYRAAKGAKAIYRQAFTGDDALSMTVGDLRQRLGIPPTGLATVPRRLHTDAEENRRAQQRQPPSATIAHA